MRQLKSPDITSSKKAVRHSKSSTAFNNAPPSVSPVKELRQMSIPNFDKKTGIAVQMKDACTSVSNIKQRHNYMSKSPAVSESCSAKK